ncbi:MAG: TIGR02281 family clan AA aspartic protease [Pseudomonadota bacterium]
MIFDSGDDTARFLYLAILGAAITAGLFAGYRHRLPSALRDAAMWGLIFFFTILAFGLKEPFMQAINPSAAIMADENSVVLRRAADGHFHAEIEVNGETLEMLVDTGATQIVLTKDDARRVGLDPASLTFFGSARTANGVVETASVRLGRMQLGRFVDRDVAASVNGGALHQSLLGMSYLDRYRSWAVEGDRMILTR